MNLMPDQPDGIFGELGHVEAHAADGPGENQVVLNVIEADDGQILRNPDALLRQHVDGLPGLRVAEGADAVYPVPDPLGQHLAHRAALGGGNPQIRLRNSGLPAGLQEALQPPGGTEGNVLQPDIAQAPAAGFDQMAGRQHGALEIVPPNQIRLQVGQLPGQYHKGHAGLPHAAHRRAGIGGGKEQHAVHLIADGDVGHAQLPPRLVPGGEDHDGISFFFGRLAQLVGHDGVVGVLQITENQPQQPGAPGAEAGGHDVAHIAHALRGFLDADPGFQGDILLVPQGVGNRINGIPRGFGHVLQGHPFSVSLRQSNQLLRSRLGFPFPERGRAGSRGRSSVKLEGIVPFSKINVNFGGKTP